MGLRWLKMDTPQGELEKWVLVDEPARIIVAELRLSPYGSWKDNNKLRNKLLLQYEAYCWKVRMENNLKFY